MGQDLSTGATLSASSGMALHDRFNDLAFFTTVHADPRQGNAAGTKIDEPSAKLADHVIVLLRNADLKDLHFPLVEADPAVKRPL